MNAMPGSGIIAVKKQLMQKLISRQFYQVMWTDFTCRPAVELYKGDSLIHNSSLYNSGRQHLFIVKSITEQEDGNTSVTTTANNITTKSAAHIRISRLQLQLSKGRSQLFMATRSDCNINTCVKVKVKVHTHSTPVKVTLKEYTSESKSDLEWRGQFHHSLLNYTRSMWSMQAHFYLGVATYKGLQIVLY